MASFKTRVDEVKRSDVAKNTLLDELLAHVDQLTKERDAAKGELDMAQDTARTYYQRMVKAESEKSHIQTSMDCDRFVLVLIDGDSMPFLNEFVSRGLEGGEDAGKHLRTAVLEYYKTLSKYHADDRVVIRIYANSKGLGRAYKSAKLIPDESVFDQFMIGFNRSHPLSDFVDAGHHKEAADSKLKANFELYYRNHHCQHIMFGGSADNSYAGFLSPFSLPGAINDRITLLEGPPFPYELRKVAQGFFHTGFRGIFRTTKIQTIPNSGQVIGAKRPATDALTSFRERPAPNSTSAAVTPPKAQPNQQPQQAAQTPPTSFTPPPFVFQNQYGQRLDVPLDVDKDYLKELYTKNTRLCNNFYLRGHCPFGDKCEWDHSQHLTKRQLDTFRHKARSSSCRDPFCQDPACCLGHMCPRGASCDISICKFLPEQHNIDCAEVYQYYPETKERKRILMPG
ncbi:hypothetical protein HRR83_004316 [Exophiala dermatitidis]|uniref:C3H1-type domain-containing protein n=2 Tax=Exophiala dermatitidis TaxID=5970 RepID=H6BQH0_EXODN|nr:uncharacterized protein HMPREF1120_02731 [Exophiala dermatitidis NIH/UT8656]KAJ4511646.1 hypothetical protein HRR73_006221 [Exophiala dermatitidis]EHY54563.1 hypothetical protein HMPREF1120_02731 [Exophiala dermatitidis NIH/UT8656]KAJ4521379.1 hypothetical protein HRR74_003202 [Exophiala dermatitidis]KAJ4542050.1 hypothetical protein HRR77_005938 [Exophiala dermatitidis]KAJ4544816.1 hypothetical protein HRR76_002855 [Exophiala dermatitidis]